MTLDSWLRFGHVLGVIVWLGGGLMLLVLGSRAQRSADAMAVVQFGRTLAYVGPRVLVPVVLAPSSSDYGWSSGVRRGTSLSFGSSWRLVSSRPRS